MAYVVGTDEVLATQELLVATTGFVVDGFKEARDMRTMPETKCPLPLYAADLTYLVVGTARVLGQVPIAPAAGAMQWPSCKMKMSAHDLQQHVGGLIQETKCVHVGTGIGGQYWTGWGVSHCREISKQNKRSNSKSFQLISLSTHQTSDWSPQ